MSYYRILGFKAEPFSNTPDPGLFYQSRQHTEVLRQLQTAIRLKRGLNVIIGDVGTGKTTISRQLIRTLSRSPDIDCSLVLDPGFTTVRGLLIHMLELLTGSKGQTDWDEAFLKEKIKQHLFSQGLDKGITTVVIIDEGQKLIPDNIEILRELLNFETNDQKLLQIIIFAQEEFEQTLNRTGNFNDRINFRYHLKGLNFWETKGMIQYRLKRCFMAGRQRPLFSMAAFAAIYDKTGGSPRKIIHLCHQVLLALIIREKKKAGFLLVRSCCRGRDPRPFLSGKAVVSVLLTLLALAGGGYMFSNRPHPPQAPAPVELGQAGTPNLHEIPAKPVKRPLPIPGAGKVPPVVLVAEHRRQPDAAPGAKAVYGSLVVPPGATLSHMINMVYGYYSPGLLKKVMASNKDAVPFPDTLLYGKTLCFPVIAGDKQYPDDAILILLKQTRDLDSAFSWARDYKDTDLRIWPCPRPGTGYEFCIVVDKIFDHPEDAVWYMATAIPGVPGSPETALSLRTGKPGPGIRLP